MMPKDLNFYHNKSPAPVGEANGAPSATDRILLVDDETFSQQYFSRIVDRSKCHIDVADDGAHAAELLHRHDYDLIILDVRLPDVSGLDLLKEIRSIDQIVPVIVVTAYGTVDDAVAAMKLGAFDFLTKPFDCTEKVLVIIKNALHQGRLEKENLLLKSQLRREDLFSNIIGKTEAMHRLFGIIKKASLVDSTVLIEGESGVGKELVARAIHNNSTRRNKPFIVVDCGGLAETLLESTLFGYEKGAFHGGDENDQGPV